MGKKSRTGKKERLHWLPALEFSVGHSPSLKLRPHLIWSSKMSLYLAFSNYGNDISKL